MDWHGDRKASASKFYPTSGRKGKKMTGKCGHDELVRQRDAKWFQKWFEMFEARHGRYPSTEEQYEVTITSTIRSEYERLADMNKTVVIDRDTSNMLATDGSTVAYLEKSILQLKADEEKAKVNNPFDYTQPSEDEVAKRRECFDLRAKCPIPLEMLRKVQDKKMPKEVLMEVYDLSEADFNRYFDAMFGE